MVRFLEREGYDVTYCTNLDTHERPDLLLSHRVFLSVGHDEYWSWEMRDHVESARDQGVHLGFFSADSALWQVRFESSPATGDPNRTLVCYKDYSDPLSAGSDRHLTTRRWRDPPVNRPEDSMMGVMTGMLSADDNMVIHNENHWVCCGTRLANGDQVQGLVGYEADALFSTYGAPAGIQIIASSPVSFPERRIDGADGLSRVTLYRVPSGANVFATGTIRWSLGLDDYNSNPAVGPALYAPLLDWRVQQMTRNVLGRFLRGLWMTNGLVHAVVRHGNTIYVGGSFTQVGPLTGGGLARNNIAAFDAATGAPTSWDPGTNAAVYALAVSGNTVYAGGAFTTAGGQARGHIAALDATTGVVTPWDPSANDVVTALAVSGNVVYVGGDFRDTPGSSTSIGGRERNYIAALDIATGTATPWDPNANDIVYALAVAKNTDYAGGDFTRIGGQTRNYIAAVDVTAGTATAWNPSANSYVFALSMSGSRIYVGGIFTNIGGQARNRIAALDAESGAVAAWNPNANSFVYALSANGNRVYAGGIFTSIGGQPRERIAALDAATGLASPWDPGTDGAVNALAVDPAGDTVYAGGAFSRFDGLQPQNHLAVMCAADMDHDGANDSQDCAPEDPATWSTPGEVGTVLVSKSGGSALLQWLPPVSPGGTAPQYDTIRSVVSDFELGSSTCVESGDSSDLTASDPTVPPAAYYYLIRARNTCGIGTLGSMSSGALRVAAPCPP